MCIICIDETNTVDGSIVQNALEISRSISKNRPPQSINYNYIIFLVIIINFIR